MEQRIHFSQSPIMLVVNELKHRPYCHHPRTMELLFVMEGELAVTMNQQSFLIRAGEFVLINPGILHSLHGTQFCTAISLYFDMEQYRAQFPNLPYVPLRCTLATLRQDQLPYYYELRNYFIRLLLMYNKKTPVAREIMEELAQKIMTLLWLHFQDRKPIPEQNLERYYGICAYLVQHFMEPVTVSEVAENQNISATRLAHFWKDASGRSIRQAITALRLAVAEQLLLSTNLTINEVAYRCSFSDEKYFYQHFKAHFKATPNEYRTWYQQSIQPAMCSQLSKQEAFRRISTYAMTYYNTDAEISLPELSVDEMEKEQALQHLYRAILVNPYLMVKLFNNSKQDIGCLQIVPGKALYFHDGQYRINWEYVYAQMHVFVDFALAVNVFVDFDCMDLEQWKPLLWSLTDELRHVWGKSVVAAQQYLIMPKDIPSYLQCNELATYLKENTPVKDAKVFFLL